MQPAKELKQKIDRRETIVGTILINHLWPEAVEVATDAGLDYFIVCLEHGAHNDELVAQVCAVGRLAGFPVLIRPKANDFRTVSKVMDLGPCGLLLACVDSPAELDVVRDAIYLPPRGKRRPGGLGNRWVSGVDRATWKQQVEDDLIVVPQIETQRGLGQADEIAAHEIVTAIGVGPYDLSMSLVGDYQPDHPDWVAAIHKIRQAGERSGKTMWRIGSNAAELADEGYTFLCMADPMFILTMAIKQGVESVRR